jgi:hypothetical protein
MKIKVWAEFDTDTREYSDWSVEGDDIQLEHSGSSYYRIMHEGKQLGTVGGHCPGSEREANFMNACGHNHLSICIDKRIDV